MSDQQRAREALILIQSCKQGTRDARDYYLLQNASQHAEEGLRKTNKTMALYEYIETLLTKAAEGDTSTK